MNRIAAVRAGLVLLALLTGLVAALAASPATVLAAVSASGILACLFIGSGNAQPAPVLVPVRVRRRR